jgi:hypothetical protein
MNGTIEGRPFVARSALMVKTNQPGKIGDQGPARYDIFVSRIRIYERPMTCRDAAAQPMSGERYIEIDLQGRWPFFPGSVWRVDGRHPNSLTDDRVQSVTYETGGSSSGTLAYGEVRFVDTNAAGGTIAMQVSAANPQFPGSISGAIPFSICS